MLQVEDLRIAYSGAVAVKGVSLEIVPGESVALIGPNGAGKTSIARAIAGLVRFDGDIRVRAGMSCTSIRHWPTWAIARSGIIYIPETHAVYESLSVQENLMIVFAAISVPGVSVAALLSGIYEGFPMLQERVGQRAGSLSGGQKKLLAIARGLLLLRSLSALPRPPLFQLLIVDEPSHGLSPQALNLVRAALSNLGISLLLLEQMARFALDVCKRGYVLRNGKIVAQGPSPELQEDTLVRSYLGTLANGPISPWNNS